MICNRIASILCARVRRSLQGPFPAAGCGAHRETRRGWTLIEILVAAGLAVLTAAIVASVFHAVVGGLAQSSRQATRYHVAVSVLERMISELEAGLDDGSAERLDGDALRIMDGSEHNANAGTSGELWFMAWLHDDEEETEPYVAQIMYTLEPLDSADRVQRLIRREWVVDEDLPRPPPPDDALREVLPGNVTGFHAEAWTPDGWLGVWPPEEDTGDMPSPALIRIVMTLDNRLEDPLTVTGTAWRAAAALLPAD